jgi:hypothetical protein
MEAGFGNGKLDKDDRLIQDTLPLSDLLCYIASTCLLGVV